jgi:YD repeat-containing protein
MEAKPFLSFLTVVLLLTLVTACSKKGSSGTHAGEGTSGYRIAAVQRIQFGTDTTDFSFTYDNQGRVVTQKSVTGGSEVNTSFVYTGNSILVTARTFTDTLTMDSVVLNDDGKISAIVSRSGRAVLNRVFTYDSQGVLTGETDQTDNNEAVASTYASADGDITATSNGRNFAYYSNQPDMPGDYWQLEQFLNYGAYYVQNAHMVETYGMGSGGDLNINYAYDSSGRVALLNVTGSLPAVFNITYDRP